ncbi:MAG: DUF4007 family protein [Deltaproteobacteria bacterium]|nr:DUF4007 family protein [Deltaproteobacteria bacterium]
MSVVAVEHGSFAGHETFPLRYTWLPKAVQHVRSDPQLFSREDAMVRLGVGKNMVRSIRHWGLATGVLEEDPNVANNRGRELKPSALGNKLFSEDGWDPYLEDPATLWLLHAQLTGNKDGPTTWYWVFNHLPQPEFTKVDLHRWLGTLATERGWSRVAASSLMRDVDCFIRSYVPAKPTRTMPLEETLDCPLVELGLIREFGGKGSYILLRGDQPSLPDELFAQVLVRFLHHRDATAKTIPLQAVAFAPGSPGRVFCLTEDALLARLERLQKTTSGAIRFDETAGLRQLYLTDELRPDTLTFLGPYYRRGRAQPKAGRQA